MDRERERERERERDGVRERKSDRERGQREASEASRESLGSPQEEEDKGTTKTGGKSMKRS